MRNARCSKIVDRIREFYLVNNRERQMVVDAFKILFFQENKKSEMAMATE